MLKISLVEQPKFTSLSMSTMYNYSCFKVKAKFTGIPSPKYIFTLWLQEVKLACHKWRVPQNFHWELPLTYHIELGLDHTKL